MTSSQTPTAATPARRTGLIILRVFALLGAATAILPGSIPERAFALGSGLGLFIASTSPRRDQPVTRPELRLAAITVAVILVAVALVLVNKRVAG
jgi:hypothetical protein